ncbi:MBL fold metallo-hydrolase [Paenibacillus sp. 7541]|uniref:MBL fold metallo-hydrolase n=1 Tax=Paenibacillus sp. 7541 TaxID=2026236 RepID=UPI000BA6F4DD|nr:MBL fold metallo-hydrolase [Paenibacillus sp. 7541]PAK51124.1 hypothetical protein CHH75_15480 [Paenibacillus sp. 7541]
MSSFIAAMLLMLFIPAFGRRPDRETQLRIKGSVHYKNNKFVNDIPTSTRMSMLNQLSVLWDFARGKPADGRPSSPIELVMTDIENTKPLSDFNQAIWFGHSSVLIDLDGERLLFDPMFGRSPFPFPKLGSKRFNDNLPIDVKNMPAIDAVFLSHDHYDHLDYYSIQHLKDKVGHFFVPLGVAGHLERWGVPRSNITQMDWWEELEWEGLKIVCTPARHVSGRSFLHKNRTLWCSWSIIGLSGSVFFSGDSGYGPHFRQIGEKYGPFQLTLVECGQYDERWPDLHMYPEESVQAHMDLRGELMLPIHWAAFQLAPHGWLDPIHRVMIAAKKQSITITVPRMGESVSLQGDNYPVNEWWSK